MVPMVLLGFDSHPVVTVQGHKRWLASVPPLWADLRTGKAEVPDLAFMLEPRHKALLVLSFGIVKHGCHCFSVRIPGNGLEVRAGFFPFFSFPSSRNLRETTEDWEENTSASFLDIS